MFCEWVGAQSGHSLGDANAMGIHFVPIEIGVVWYLKYICVSLDCVPLVDMELRFHVVDSSCSKSNVPLMS